MGAIAQEENGSALWGQEERREIVAPTNQGVPLVLKKGDKVIARSCHAPKGIARGCGRGCRLGCTQGEGE